MFFLVTRGLHFSIEFTGGNVVEVEYAQPADVGKARTAIEALGFGEVQVQNFGTSRDVLVRLPLREGVKQAEVVGRVFGALCATEGGKVAQRETTSDKGEQISRPVCEANGAEPVHLKRSEYVGPQVGKELATKGLGAVFLVLLGIMARLAGERGAENAT